MCLHVFFDGMRVQLGVGCADAIEGVDIAALVGVCLQQQQSVHSSVQSSQQLTVQHEHSTARHPETTITKREKLYDLHQVELRKDRHS